ncbi:FAD-binding and (Fe-S)-binding domain-containing protein [Campylobacter aviculae]|uniref:D-lactate dehydrogenase (cytochrome) n=1 Tax=Campylobacter aviculae TaxID=2510190 RepID=A0A4U7BQ10_9BACT|nr:FAD-binding and (Fe-S)-binding domain-containing protein [Campylobacter aviculae]TKX31016.1 FAD-binding oxidoreductase [Campylobacter aviculae]
MLNDFKNECKSFLQDRLYDSYLKRFAYGIDASCYRYIPDLVLKPICEEEVLKIINLSRKYNIPLTFRGAGTSLSGQACAKSVLVICMNGWDKIVANENSIWCDCGVIGSEANIVLSQFNKKLGPDPATINNATIGGIFSNNSSGMCCGVKQNSYQTIKSIRVILYDGFILDTSDEKCLKEFLNTHSQMVDEILNLRQDIIKDENLLKEIKRKFSIKNTTGYGLNSLSDFEDIKDILNHIFIGSEGTLGFVSRVEYFTVDDYKHKACALLFYENLSLAAKAVKILSLNDEIVSAAEIMDYACLEAVSNLQGMPDELTRVKEGNCCILIQLQNNDKNILEKNIAFISEKLNTINTLFGIRFSFDPNEQETWWKIRKGLLPISASTKRSGSTVITEDICFEIDYFEKGIEGITSLFKQYDFKGIIFGHALSGNVHFIITPLLNDPKEKENFAKFMDDMVNLVLSLKGSTKAEHGTGRMMAPFVEQEWGEKAYKLNKKIKNIFDPKNLFNPDVIICDDPKIHIKNLKQSQKIEDYIETCMECGFCEKVCPSKNITLTPRQRIAVHREIKRLESLENKNEEENLELSLLKQEYEYEVITSCATCSMCSTICPLEINSAKISIHYNNEKARGLNIAKTISNNLEKVVKIAKFGVSAASFASKIFGDENLKNISLLLNKNLKTPVVLKFMPSKNTYVLNSKNKHFNKEVIYFTSCLNRIFAPNSKAKDLRSIQEVFENLCQKAKFNVIYPKHIEQMCCGKAFKNYTLKDSSINPVHKALSWLLEEVKDKDIPIVCDHSACSAEILHQIKELKSFSKLKILDMSDFLNDYILKELHINPLKEDIGIYVVCASKKESFGKSLKHIAQSCTKAKVYEHQQTYCCAFAGNKGFLEPKLNDVALDNLQQYFKDLNIKRFYSSSSTCEIGLSDKTGASWQHIIYLLDEVSSEKSSIEG